MSDLIVELDLCASEADAKALLRGLMAFNRSVVPELERIDDAYSFHVFTRDTDGSLVGGLMARCYWNTLHIELLWIDDAARGHGSGRSMLAEAEAHALNEGFTLAYVETTSWQALGFYQAAGYALMGTVEGRPIGHATHYLKKRLAR